MCRQNFPKLWCRYEFIVHNRLRNFETVPEWIQQKICRKFSETDTRKLLLKTAPFRDWFFSFQHYEKIIVSQAVHHNPSGRYASRCWAKRKWLHILWQTIPEVRTNRVERKHSAEKYDNQSMKFTHSAVASSPFYPRVSLNHTFDGSIAECRSFTGEALMKISQLGTNLTCESFVL